MNKFLVLSYFRELSYFSAFPLLERSDIPDGGGAKPLFPGKGSSAIN